MRQNLWFFLIASLLFFQKQTTLAEVNSDGALFFEALRPLV
jgi:hypothetical protein